MPDSLLAITIHQCLPVQALAMFIEYILFSADSVVRKLSQGSGSQGMHGISGKIRAMKLFQFYPNALPFSIFSEISTVFSL